MALDGMSIGYLGLPSKELGTEYVVLAYPNERITGFTDSQGTQIAIAAGEDDTVVTIIPSVDVSPGTHVASYRWPDLHDRGQRLFCGAGYYFDSAAARACGRLLSV